MNKLHKEMNKIFKECLEISVKKNHDYAGEEDPFKNFRYSEALGICSVEEGILVRLCDKISRMANLLKKEAKVEDESFEDTAKDAINYLAILVAYRRLEKGGSHEKNNVHD